MGGTTSVSSTSLRFARRRTLPSSNAEEFPGHPRRHKKKRPLRRFRKLTLESVDVIEIKRRLHS